MILCSFGCGQEAKHMVDFNKYCCEKYPSLCPNMIRTYAQNKCKEDLLKKHVVTLVDEETYRSLPNVNIPDDMVRVTLSMPLMEWRKLKSLIEIVRT